MPPARAKAGAQPVSVAQSETSSDGTSKKYVLSLYDAQGDLLQENEVYGTPQEVEDLRVGAEIDIQENEGAECYARLHEVSDG